jgi:acid phosphatase type 7
VFTGHVHNYQRTYPVRFQESGPAKGEKTEGKWTLDKTFDGISNTKTDGVIWIVTGGGGASLKGGNRDNKPQSWQPYTARYYSAKHSFTLVAVSPEGVTVRQIARDGEEIDRFRITR